MDTCAVRSFSRSLDNRKQPLILTNDNQSSGVLQHGWRGAEPMLTYPHVFTLMGWSDTTTRVSPGRSLVLRSAPPYLAPNFLAKA